MPDARFLYFDLLKKCLTGKMQNSAPVIPFVTPSKCAFLLKQANEAFRQYLAPLGHSVESFLGQQSMLDFSLESLYLQLHNMHPVTTPDTMSDLSSIDNLQFCIEKAIKDRVPGDLIETGVWKGGLPVFMRGVLKAYDVSDRMVWVADSFAGLPKPDPEKNLADSIWYSLLEPLDGLKISRDCVENTFRKYGLLDEQVKFLQGWFSDTLPAAPIQSLAVMRLDGDWYESTQCALNALYPKLSPGGFIIIDDYGLPVGCRNAVDEYRKIHHIDAPIKWVNQQVVYWRKA